MRIFLFFFVIVVSGNFGFLILNFIIFIVFFIGIGFILIKSVLIIGRSFSWSCFVFLILLFKKYLIILCVLLGRIFVSIEIILILLIERIGIIWLLFLE